MITLTVEIFQEISETTFINPETFLIKNDVMDNLIWHCILDQSRLYPTEEKVFISGNSNDFGKQNVQEALRNAGLNKYFTRTQDFLGWLQSQSTL